MNNPWIVEAAKSTIGMSQMINATSIVIKKEIGMAFFAGILSPTKSTAAHKMGVNANRAKRKLDTEQGVFKSW